eukprot:scaffold1519_cov250-Pinguiococcus_pyrenoidosus.AAC.8
MTGKPPSSPRHCQFHTAVKPTSPFPISSLNTRSTTITITALSARKRAPTNEAPESSTPSASPAVLSRWADSLPYQCVSSEARRARRFVRGDAPAALPLMVSSHASPSRLVVSLHFGDFNPRVHPTRPDAPSLSRTPASPIASRARAFWRHTPHAQPGSLVTQRVDSYPQAAMDEVDAAPDMAASTAAASPADASPAPDSTAAPAEAAPASKAADAEEKSQAAKTPDELAAEEVRCAWQMRRGGGDSVAKTCGGV